MKKDFSIFNVLGLVFTIVYVIISLPLIFYLLGMMFVAVIIFDIIEFLFIFNCLLILIIPYIFLILFLCKKKNIHFKIAVIFEIVLLIIFVLYLTIWPIIKNKLWNHCDLCDIKTIEKHNNDR